MNRGLDKQSLFGLLLAVVVLGAAGWLMFGNKNNDSNTQKIGQIGADSQGATILRSELDDTLTNKPQGMIIARTGSGVLKDAAKWSFAQQVPNAGGTIMDATGKEITIASNGAGPGATLTIQPVSSAQLAESDLRETLSDIGVKLIQNGAGYKLSSATLTARSVVLDKQKLVAAGIFLASQCKGSSKSLNADLIASCKNSSTSPISR